MTIETFDKYRQAVQKALDYGKNSHTVENVRESIAQR